MKRIVFILFLLPVLALAQRPVVYKILADTLKVTTIDNSGAEFVLHNDTKDTTGVLFNTGDGATQFRKMRTQKINDSTYVVKVGISVQGDSIKIKYPASIAYVDSLWHTQDSIAWKKNGKTYFLNDEIGSDIHVTGYSKNAGRDSIVLILSDGTRFSVLDSTGVSIASNGLSLDGDTVELGGTLTSSVIIDGQTYQKNLTITGKDITFSNPNKNLYSVVSETFNAVAGYAIDTATTRTNAYAANQYGASLSSRINNAYSTDVAARADSVTMRTTVNNVFTEIGIYNNKINTLGDVVPNSNGTYDLGSVSNHYDTIFVDNIYPILPSGTVTNIASGNGLTGGPITTTGTLSVDTSIIVSKTFLTDRGYTGNTGTVTSLSTGNGLSGGTINTSGTLALDTSIAVTKTYLRNYSTGRKVDSLYKTSGKDSIQFKINGQYYAIKDSVNAGTITSVATGNGLLGGTITSSGTLALDTSVAVTKTYLSSSINNIGRKVDTLYKNNDSTAYMINGIYRSISDNDKQTLSFSNVTADSFGVTISNGNQLKFKQGFDTASLSKNADSTVLNYKRGGVWYRSAAKDSVGTAPTFSYAKNSGNDSTVATYNGTRTAVKDNGWELVTITSASSASSIVYTLDTNNTYMSYMIMASNISSNTTIDDIRIQLGYGTTPTYYTGGSDYKYIYIHAYVYSGEPAGNVSKIASNAISYLPIANVTNENKIATNFNIQILNNSNNGRYKLMQINKMSCDETSAVGVYDIGTGVLLQTRPISSIKIYAVSSTFNGTLKLYRLK